MKKIFFAHYWWKVGGAENVLFDWMKSVYNKSDVYIFDIVFDGLKKDYNVLRHNFSSISNEQFECSHISKNPMHLIRYCWKLIELEQPNLIFIMSNPFFMHYLLSLK